MVPQPHRRHSRKVSDTRQRPLLQSSAGHSFGGCHYLGPRRKVLLLRGLQQCTTVKWLSSHNHCGRLVDAPQMLATVPYTTGHYTGNPALFLYTPSSILPEHSVLTDVQQATGRNGQQWITCRSGGEGTRPEIWMGSELVPTNSTANSATIGLGTQHPNGLYHCSSAQSQKEYFSLFFRNSGTNV